MKAVRYSTHGGPEVLEIVHIPIPEPGPNQVLVKVKASSVNPFDWKIRSGKVPKVQNLPRGTGMDASGIVDAVGEGVTDVVVGDEVFGLAANREAVAEYALLHHWGKKPASMSWVQAAALPLAVETALRAIRLSGAKKGDTVLLDGASGSVGAAAVQFATDLGIKVIGTASEERADFLWDIGAVPIAHGDGLAERIAEVAPEGIDLVWDFSGRMIPELIELVGDPDKVTGIVDHQLGRELGIRDTSASETVGAFDALGEAARLFEEGRFQIALGPIFSLEQTGEAQEANRLGTHAGKLIIEVDEA